VLQVLVLLVQLVPPALQVLARLAAFGILDRPTQILLAMNRCSQIFLMETLKMI
jgi:hypothetical protein